MYIYTHGYAVKKEYDRYKKLDENKKLFSLRLLFFCVSSASVPSATNVFVKCTNYNRNNDIFL